MTRGILFLQERISKTQIIEETQQINFGRYRKSDGKEREYSMYIFIIEDNLRWDKTPIM